MFIYTKEMINNFKFKFNGLECVEKSYSQCLQEMFVLAVLNGKQKGTFLEIGAFQPQFISNTFLLESVFDWKGISIDIDNTTANMFKNSTRTCKFIHSDALILNYEEILNNNFKDRIDYLSLDIEPNINTLKCLKLIPFDKFRFSIITFETDVYSDITNIGFVREESRKLLLKNNYDLIVGNISNLDNEHPFEDWYIDSTIFNKEIINKFKRNTDDALAAHLYMLNS